ncbi:hypothetical protein A2276_01665 [candidate division WOR-1 bacterium RIFOXYA12_FULL_43_27]|uniref:Polymerase beta nucleotidyltransferase domain-containing protein n=1 Tax=candidate division WOR-1 bacterium RIFOXYC2_FULL_46_14 TaxID=1802587 RepID=A0A1F4U6T9_UNCSA|nr:MAG: hypothetical protein A2276_01665 [candidate division WOR-1 bacterium RIFOXYA12_FULL_43_27]OGC19567.1 MAG: hypothetical protein A2292_02665 [candidate division WOR-1 bacterium RIFOXYB2_FULL_46_45]OGC30555.1 MAG: hypothetical protein A2232_02665 [candidate division WOR-1 bacterium RIFOXYA2_FULL_46_56]OGC40622.1 MAG: hypothetical protein A2438_06380 [candidate division WOR-1 bacterium RIFOXYC2_FULL_46_14]
MVTEEKVNQVVETIKKIVQPDQIYLFGSYVSGKTKENSDLDVCIIKDNVKDKHKELFMVRKELFDIGMPIDMLLLNKGLFHRRKDIWGTVQYEISHKGVKVYEK